MYSVQNTEPDRPPPGLACITSIRADDAQLTILRVFRDISHLVFTMALIISYSEAIKTQRD